MNPEIPSTPEDSSPQNIEQATQSLFRQAEDAEHLGEWAQAISAYQTLLKKLPNNARIHMALGKAFEGRSSTTGEKAFLLSAMEQYRLTLRLSPQLLEANEALLSAAYRSDSLEELLSEYRLRYKSDPDNPLFKDFVRKAETLLSLPRAPAKEAPLPVGQLTYFMITRILPASSLLSFLLTMVFTFRPRTMVSSLIAHISLRAGICLAVIYLFCWILITRV